jgi:putative PIN family toxin of toxin-antitoxin system
MVDTNVLISALFFPGSMVEALLCKIIAEHQLVLSSYVVDELLHVTRRKFPGKVSAVDALLGRLPYEMVYTPGQPTPGLFEIRDKNDYPVLYSAVTEGVDIFVTGDKDFEGLGLETPEIMTPVAFLEKY